MRYISISVPTFNVVKYIFVVLILTPLTEFVTRLAVCALAKAILLLTGSVTVSDSRAGFWGMHSHYLGQRWNGKLVIMVAAAWLIASEMLFEFSFNSDYRLETETQQVWQAIPAPSWDEVVRSTRDGKNNSMEYYQSTSDVDYDLLYDGISSCQSAGFVEELEEPKRDKFTIRQKGAWAQAFRSIDKLDTLCGENSTVTLTAVLTVTDVESWGVGADIFSPGNDSVAEDVLQRFEAFSDERQLFWEFELRGMHLDMYISEDRIVCIPNGPDFALCIMEESQRFRLYSYFSWASNPAKLISEFIPQATQRDPLLNLVESMAIAMSIGSFKPDVHNRAGMTFTARHLREIMQLFLSLDSNGGITRYDSRTNVTVRAGRSSVIRVNSYAFIAVGLWTALLLTVLIVFVGCHVVANVHRNKFGIKHERRQGWFALQEVRLGFSNGFLLEKIKHDLYEVQDQSNRKQRPKTVEFRIVNGKEKQQSVAVLAADGGVPRNYARELEGFGSNPRRRTLWWKR